MNKLLVEDYCKRYGFEDIKNAGTMNHPYYIVSIRCEESSDIRELGEKLNQSSLQQPPEVGEDDIEKMAEGLWARHSLSSEHLPDHDELMDKADFTAALREFNQKSEK
jgi:hypothetical protein